MMLIIRETTRRKVQNGKTGTEDFGSEIKAHSDMYA
jgi:hypothetical protein